MNSERYFTGQYAADPSVGQKPEALRPSGPLGVVLGAIVRGSADEPLGLDIDNRVGVAQLLQALVGVGLVITAMDGERLYVMRREDWVAEPGVDIAITVQPR